ncbi:MAG TPA: hypothetical protein PK264_22115, partial [Hyphomicrobiaceae bacterium]|nr:hypothetical protein [Hyphomicrobiaceae bacterium]
MASSGARHWLLAALVAFAGAPAAAGQDALDMLEVSPAIVGRDNPRDQLMRSVAGATEGRLRIQKAAETALALGDGPTLKAAVTAGSLAIVELPMASLEVEGAIYLADQIPFLAVSFAEARTRYGALHRFLAERLSEEGLVLLYAVPRPPRGLLS